MRVLIMKKTTLFLLAVLFIFVSVFALNATDLKVGAAYFVVNRKIPIYSVETNENTLSISFDAAWGADKTEQIMSVCDDFGVKATFFLVGFWIEKYPEMVKQIYNRGFEIGLHSNTHPDMTKLTRSEMRNELKTNIQLVENLTGYRPKLFRPPYGYYNNNLIEVCEDLGLSVIEWSVDSLDWKGLSASELSGRVISRVKSGSIVLFHNNSDHIIDGLKMVLTYFQSKNIKNIPIGELIYYKNFTIDTQGTQKRIKEKI